MYHSFLIHSSADGHLGCFHVLAIYFNVYFPSGSVGKESASNQEIQVQSEGQEDPLDKKMATHSRTLAWRIPWTEEQDRLQSMKSQSRTWLCDFHFCSYVYLFKYLHQWKSHSFSFKFTQMVYIIYLSVILLLLFNHIFPI